ncbi:MAG TPA: methyl-accepting chemotaxis protein [Longimicrobiales bacterium]
MTRATFWTIKRRIVAGFALGLVLLVGVTATGIVALRGATAGKNEALAHEREVLAPAFAAEGSVRTAAEAFLRYLIEREDEDLKQRDAAVEVARRQLRQLRDSARSVESRALWEEALSLLEEWDEVSRAAIAARAGGRGNEMIDATRRSIDVGASLGRTVARGIQTAERRTREITAQANAEAKRMQLLLLGGGLLALLAGYAGARYLTRAVNDPLRESAAVIASSAAEILAATAQQASAASQSSTAVSDTVATVEEVAQTAEQAAQRAKAVAESAQNAFRVGEAGRAAVESSVATMGELSDRVQSIADSILELAQQAHAIGDIIATVDDIAEQTHLLALNAAIEAARAGEHGRGFAVVASEVRELADQSRKATVRVREILGEIQRATGAAVMTTEEGTKRVAAGVAQVTEAGETIGALADALAEASRSAAQIVASAGQQAAGMGQIREAISGIEEATQQNLASVRQAERAAEDLNELGGRLLELVGGERTGVRPLRGRR